MSSYGPPDRFNEERATYAVRGSDTPDIEAGVAAIRNVLQTLPTRSGVYRMHDAKGDVLYVGKARSLKQRVANYTQVKGLTKRLQRMIAQTRSMTIVTTNNEAEALLLEAQLIKRYRPAYNVLLRDDKSFPFILLRGDHDFPRVQKHRGARRAPGNYYGPFASAGSVNNTLNALQKLFLLRSCTDGFFKTRDRPCLLYQIKRCSAPCVGRIDKDGYKELVDDCRDFLAGKSTKVQAKLGAQMQAAAETMDFELAALLRDRLKALTFVQGTQAINAEGVGDADVFALACKDGVIGIQAFFIRGGQNWGHRSFFPQHTNDVPEDEVLASFLTQFYEEVPPPKTILLDRELGEGALLGEALGERAGYKVALSVPQRGDRRRLMDQAKRNAIEALERRLAESTTQAKLLREVAELFDLGDPPDRIEIYDNSHIQGSNAVGAMVVAGPEGFRKGQYRKWNIKGNEAATDSDVGMMREVFRRRFARQLEEAPDRDDGTWPDLVLIDGGKPQLGAAKAVLEDLGIEDVCLVGIAKGPHHGREGREVFHLLDGREFQLPVNAPVLFYLQRLRDEVHRFVIGAHRDKRAKAIGASPLDEVPGIGPARKKALLMHFGTGRAVRNASLEDLKKAPGVSAGVAQQVYDFYHAR
ncbi:excinuclease ABC subunit C [Arthrobacter sp. TPD3018]|jgi:excinuclease ABC subunit C|uniref:excinuclease ABC subunit UvrC n=1 Tax=Bacteria TaxID=2 RepID=UPI000D50FAE8|nr:MULTISPECIES: excinuclease ABC subunit UvrC [Bacteria]PVE59373.1 excinuclease ABC subunit C [Sphingomonas sp. TPD3009]PVE60893.1 excinuclease ABC subunit C [Arthrobacter sp. TPD3018]PVE87573.1 excinuclease ABC subunit C [Sphingomonas melonis]RTL21165.1 MAG: excinuclease ABC subunit UvrC [Sphingomonadaceae bacterium]